MNEENQVVEDQVVENQVVVVEDQVVENQVVVVEDQVVEEPEFGVETPVQEVVSVTKRGRGRPPVYTGIQRLYLIALIGAIGLTKTRKLVNSSGVVRNNFAKKFGVDIEALKAICPHKLNLSLAWACYLGKEGGVKLSRGRPKKVVAAEAAAQVAQAPVAG